ncbi:MAG: bacterial Ig-like domain-containing protein [Oscillospiraceae bacterium]
MKKRTRLLAVMIAITMILTIVPTGLFANATDKLISTYEELKKIGNDPGYPLNGSYKLANDITVLDSESNWIPIGRDATDAGGADLRFTGSFNGDGKKIINLKIIGTIPVPANSPAGTEPTPIKEVGLFGCLSETATVSNLTIADSSIININPDTMDVGFIAGINKGTITNCASSKNTITTDSLYGQTGIGGIVGTNYNKITKCYNSSDFTVIIPNNRIAMMDIGGIVGVNEVKKEATTTPVAPAELALIEDCFNIGTISVKAPRVYSKVGGIAGTNAGKIDKTYNAGVMCGYNTGGITGNQSSKNASSIAHSYYHEQTAKMRDGNVKTDTDTAAKLTDVEMKDLTKMPGLAATEWEVSTGVGAYPYPTIKGLPFADLAVDIVNFYGGNGRIYSPYKINNTTHLSNIRTKLSSVFELTSDILFIDWDYKDDVTNKKDFSSLSPDVGLTTLEGSFYNGGAKWVPIGYNKTTDAGGVTKINVEPFTGILLGNNFSIFNLQSSATVGDWEQTAGLFAINDGTISNLTIADKPATEDASKLLIANNSYSSIVLGDEALKLHFTQPTVTSISGSQIVAASTSSTATAGAICALNYKNGVIDNVTNKATVVAISVPTPTKQKPVFEVYAGGITAINSGGIIKNTRNEGTVNAISNTLYAVAGGIVGSNEGYLSSVVNTGTVEAGYTADIASTTAPGATAISMDTVLKSAYLAAGGIAGESIKAEENKKEITLINDAKNIGGVMTTLTSNGTKDNFYAGGIVGNGAGVIGANCAFWNKSAKYAVENQPLVFGAGKDLTDASLNSITGYKEDSFMSMEVPTPPVNGYSQTNYQSDINGKISTSTAQIYKNNSSTPVTTEKPSVAYKTEANSKYILVTTKVTESSKPVEQALSGTTNFIIMIAPVSVKADSTNAKNIFYEGEKFSPGGLVVTATYDDGTTQQLNYGDGDSEYSVEGYNPATKGEQTLTVKFNGAKGMTVTNPNPYKVTVYDATFSFKSKKSSYLKGYIFTDKDFTAELSYGPSDNIKKISKPFKSNEFTDGYTTSVPFASIDTTTAKTGVTVTATYGTEAPVTATFDIVAPPAELTTKDAVNYPLDTTDPANKKIIAPLGATVAQLKANLGGGEFAVVKKNGVKQADDALVGTGWVISLMDGTTENDKATAIVKGDVTMGGKSPGDGEIDIMDFLAIKAEVLLKERLTGDFAKAGDYNGDGAVDIMDILAIKKIMLKK